MNEYDLKHIPPDPTTREEVFAQLQQLTTRKRELSLEYCALHSRLRILDKEELLVTFYINRAIDLLPTLGGTREGS